MNYFPSRPMNSDRIVCLAALCCLSFAPIHTSLAEDLNSAELSNLSLEELMDIPIQVASRTDASSREAAGVVTALNEEDIQHSGARDLIDVLALIPGIQFGVDVEGVTSIGMRGQWGTEGKVLLLWNGHEINELMYSGVQLGNRFPVDQIKKVEVVRGPGSALYGGHAELGVINVILKGAKDLNGGLLTSTYGQMKGKSARRTENFSYGYAEGDLQLSGGVFEGAGNRGNRTYRDMSGDSYNLADNAEINPFMANVDLSYSNLQIKYLFERYDTSQRDEFGENLPRAVGVNFTSHHLFASYDLALGDRTYLVPRLRFSNQRPWQEDFHEDFDNFIYDKTVQHFAPSLELRHNFNDNTEILLGGEYSQDRARNNFDSEEALFFNGLNSLSYKAYCLYSQLGFVFSGINFTGGLRYNNHEEYGSSSVPRLSATKVFGKLHLKALASRAFRSPGIENINANKQLLASGYPGGSAIEPEKAVAYELEAGYRFRDNLSLVSNLFYGNIENPIIYFYDARTEAEGYLNAEKTGSTGLETELRWRSRSGNRLTINHSFYTATDEGAATYKVPGHGSAYLGMAQHKIGFHGSFPISRNVRFGPSLIAYSKRYGYDSADEDGNVILRDFDPLWLLNLYISYLPESLSGFEFGLGAYNILGQNFRYIQPYNNYHPSLPAQAPEVLAKVTIKF